MLFLTVDKKTFNLLYKTPSTPYTPQIPRLGGTVSSTFSSRMPRLINDVQEVSTVRPDAKENMRGVAVIPIVYKSAQYGAILICYNDVHNFTREEQILCDFIGHSAAQAITINRTNSNLKNFKYTLDNTLDSIFIFHPDSLKLLYVNKGALAISGRSRADLLKRNLSDIIIGTGEQGGPGKRYKEL